MRIMQSLLATLLATGAILPSGGKAEKATDNLLSSAEPPRHAIVIKEQSNVCVSVRVDPRFLPPQRSTGTNREWALSGVLASAMARLYERQGGSLILPGGAPGGNLDPRFVANMAEGDAGSRLCDRRGDDIFLTVRYLPRPDGSPFRTEYRVEQGHRVRTGVLPRSPEIEARARRMTTSSPGQDSFYAIALDVRARADALITLMMQRRHPSP
jgi:hypothetical protein